jgi:hypothetical protein
VHHLIPSSQQPELFYEPMNLVACCTRCNFSDGRKIAVENRNQELRRLRGILDEQARQINWLRAQLARSEHPAEDRRHHPIGA